MKLAVSVVLKVFYSFISVQFSSGESGISVGGRPAMFEKLYRSAQNSNDSTRGEADASTAADEAPSASSALSTTRHAQERPRRLMRAESIGDMSPFIDKEIPGQLPPHWMGLEFAATSANLSEFTSEDSGLTSYTQVSERMAKSGLAPEDSRGQRVAYLTKPSECVPLDQFESLNKESSEQASVPRIGADLVFTFFDADGAEMVKRKLIPGHDLAFEMIWEGSKSRLKEELKEYDGTRKGDVNHDSNFETISTQRFCRVNIWADADFFVYYEACPRGLLMKEPSDTSDGSMRRCFLYRMTNGNFRIYYRRSGKLLPRHYMGVDTDQIDPKTELGEISEKRRVDALFAKVQGFPDSYKFYAYAYPFGKDLPEGGFVYFGGNPGDPPDSIHTPIGLKSITAGSKMTYERIFQGPSVIMPQGSDPCEMKPAPGFADADAFCFEPSCKLANQSYVGCFIYRLKPPKSTMADSSGVAVTKYRAYARQDQQLLPNPYMGLDFKKISVSERIGEISDIAPIPEEYYDLDIFPISRDAKYYAFVYPVPQGPLGRGGWAFLGEDRRTVLILLAVFPGTNRAHRKVWQGTNSDVVLTGGCQFHPDHFFADVVSFCWNPKCPVGSNQKDGCFVYEMRGEKGLNNGKFRAYAPRPAAMLPVPIIGIDLVTIEDISDVELGLLSEIHDVAAVLHEAEIVPAAHKRYAFAYPKGTGPLSGGAFIYYDEKGEVVSIKACSPSFPGHSNLKFVKTWQTRELQPPKGCEFQRVTWFTDVQSFCWIPECKFGQLEDTTMGCFIYKMKDRGGLRAYLMTNDFPSAEDVGMVLPEDPELQESEPTPKAAEAEKPKPHKAAEAEKSAAMGRATWSAATMFFLWRWVCH